MPWPCRTAGDNRIRGSPTKIRLFLAREGGWQLGGFGIEAGLHLVGF